MFKDKLKVDAATIYNLKDSVWLGVPSKENDWWFGVQNTSVSNEERNAAANYIANAVNSYEELKARVTELEDALKSISSLSGSQPCQFPDHIQDEIALIHDKTMEKVYELSSYLLEGLAE
jgi:hypothetical protein